MGASSFVTTIKAEASRVGLPRAVERSVYLGVNRYVTARRLDVIHLTREHLAPSEPAATKIKSRLATEDDLQRMRSEGRWDVGEELLAAHRAGDRCLLSYIDGKLAGYTWVHAAGTPHLFEGLRLRIPDEYLYNYAGFTHPEFRGHGLQAYRHHEILRRPEWRDRKGLLGYVQCVNWSSRRGQTKSGYRPLGWLGLVGTRSRFAVFVSRELEQLGIRRIHV